MTRPTLFGLGVLLGALSFPAGYHLAAHLSGHHYLAIDLDIKETP